MTTFAPPPQGVQPEDILIISALMARTEPPFPEETCHLHGAILVNLVLDTARQAGFEQTDELEKLLLAEGDTTDHTRELARQACIAVGGRPAIDAFMKAASQTIMAMIDQQAAAPAKA